MKKTYSKNKKLIFLLTLSFLHSVFLVFITFWLLERNYTYGDEKFLIKWGSIVKKKILGMDAKPPANDFLFINTSYDNMLIDKTDDDGFTVGNQVITDRQLLAKLFSMINTSGSCKYVLCDIFFADKSPYDSALYTQLKTLKNVIVPFHLKPDGTPEYPLFKVNIGLTDYNIIDGGFLKYSLTRQDTLKSIPLKMYEDMTGSYFTNVFPFSYMNGDLSFNNIIIDFKIRYYDLLEEKNPGHYPYVNLGEFLSLPDSMIANSLKNRIILIGNLKTSDMHSTPIGTMPGTLILLNTYLTLDSKENLIKPYMIFILLLSYFLISLDVFSSKDLSERKFTRIISSNKTGKFFIKIFTYIFYLGVTSLIIYFLYNIHINILIIAVYLKILDSILTYARQKPVEKDGKEIAMKILGFRKAILKLIKS